MDYAMEFARNSLRTLPIALQISSLSYYCRFSKEEILKFLQRSDSQSSY